MPSAGAVVVPRLGGDGELHAPGHRAPSPVVRDGHQDPPVLLAAGDIADCEDGAPSATAELVDRLEGAVAALGDLAYPAGAAEDFVGCHDPTWGAFRDRTRPAPDNHDVMTDRGAAYYRYFGGLAGRDGQGWYSYDLGDWHVAVLNSNCELVGGCDADSPRVA